MKLITELVEQVEYVTEEKNGRKFLFLEGPFLQAGVKNRNGRIYPPPVMEREVSRYIQEKISRGCAYGELGHPNGPGINMDRVSHIVTELKKTGNDYHGKAKVIDEGLGKIARGIIEAEGRLGVSSRGMGTLKEDAKLGARVVQDDFHLAVAADIVADPSAPAAWVNGVMEGVEWVLNEQGEWEQRQIEQIRHEVRRTPSSLLPERKAELFESFLQGLIEQEMVRSLSSEAGVPAESAERAVRRARLKAKLTGNPSDQKFVWSTAKEILGISGR